MKLVLGIALLAVGLLVVRASVPDSNNWLSRWTRSDFSSDLVSCLAVTLVVFGIAIAIAGAAQLLGYGTS